MSSPGRRRPPGEIRQSQVITTFGPGAMMDLPNHSVLMGGLDYWFPLGEEIAEPRLAAKLCRLLDLPAVHLRLPPADQEDPAAPMSGIKAWHFPEWCITRDVRLGADQPHVRARRLVHRRTLQNGRFVDDNRQRHTVVPVRFVRACKAGHISDIDWYRYVHTEPTECRRPLWMDERGTSGDLAEVYVRCECGQERSMAQAAVLRHWALGPCDGARPWLGPYTHETCGEPSRLLIRTASNAYFPQTMRVISLPDRNEAVSGAVDLVWEFLEAVADGEELRYERRKARVHAALEGFADDEVLAEIQARRTGAQAHTLSVKQAELETLVASSETLGEDKPDGVFFARTLPKVHWDRPWMQPVARIVLVHRLREVVALVGFTRFEAQAPDIEGELEMGVRRAALARETTWLPAIENKGEGVFVQLHREAVHAWQARADVQRRGQQLAAGFARWQQEHSGTQRQFPGVPYIMLHSLAHLLTTAVALECGYPASALRERIYALPQVGYGVLVYTGTTDAEGTLGGLIQMGQRIHAHLRTAFALGELCSNDPVCAQHQPQSPHEHRFLHGAACHGCLFLAETSCEQHNEFLDRALVVPTVENLGVQFFPWPTL